MTSTVMQLTCPNCGSHDLTEPHWNGYVTDAIECRDRDSRMGVVSATPGTEEHEFIKARRRRRAFAQYKSRETQVRYYLGAWYIVRHDMHPHTHLTDAGPVTKQGHKMLVGIRQGEGNDDHGFTIRYYRQPDTEPRYVPAGYR